MAAPDPAPDASRALSALLTAQTPSTALHTGQLSQAPQGPSEPCPWHTGDLRRRERFKLSLESPCPACHSLARNYCYSHTGLPLQAKVHHERAQLAEQTQCRCGLDDT